MKWVFLLLFILISINIVEGKIYLSPDEIIKGGSLIINIDEENGVYNYVPVYTLNYALVDVIRLDCNNPICYGKTVQNYFADLDPGNYLMSVYKYENSDWENIYFNVYGEVKSETSDDLKYVNNRPVVEGIPNFDLYLNEENVDVVDFDQYSYDKDGDDLSYFINGAKSIDNEFVYCNVDGSKLKCNLKKEGEINVVVKSTDGEKFDTDEFKIIVKDKISENSPPVANAGENVKAVMGEKIVLDGSESYDLENNIPSSQYFNGEPVYKWYSDDKNYGEKKKVVVKFDERGEYKIKLRVYDSLGLYDEDEILISVEDKLHCKNTETKYYPEDTKCESKWPSNEGSYLNVNTREYSCDVVEVCDDDLDYIVEEAIDCCDGSLLKDDRFEICSFANAMSEGRSKKCEALYLVKSFGSGAVYMQDYFEAEMCCYGVEGLCENEANFFKAEPFPKSNIKFDILNCQTTEQFLLGKTKPVKGWWNSDSDMSENNIALDDVPTHVSVNLLSTGTCVDYTFGLTTLLRKADYKADEVYSVETKDHAFTLVKLDGDRKYTAVDTTGNNYAIVIGGKPQGYDYCNEMQHCYNDVGEFSCPSLTEVYGCEQKAQQIGLFGFYFFLAALIMVILIIAVIYVTRRKNEKNI